MERLILEKHFTAEYGAGLEGVWDSQFCQGLTVRATSPDRGEFRVALEGEEIGRVYPGREGIGQRFEAVPVEGNLPSPASRLPVHPPPPRLLAPRESRECWTFGEAVVYLWDLVKSERGD